MGCYVNPRNMPKEEWLLSNGGKPTLYPQPITETHLPVVLVNNGAFTAAGVAYNKREVDEFSDPNDVRAKMWFYCSREDLRTVSDLSDYEK